MRRFNKGDIVEFEDADFEVICADNDKAVLANTYLRLDNKRVVDYKNVRVYHNEKNADVIPSYTILFKC